MKKLELKFGSIKEMLTKEQMKKISGGNFSCSYQGPANPWGSFSCDTSSGITACECQDLADTLCESSDSCEDIDCGCK